MSPASREEFCRSCGGPVAVALDGRKHCGRCGREVFENPVPVVIGLVPVGRDDLTGLLVLRRGIEPGKGRLALPGGFLEIESWQAGLSREVEEETRLAVPPAAWSPVHFASSEPRPDRLLVFAACPPVPVAAIPAFVPDAETEALGLVFRAEGLEAAIAFPLHLDRIRAWFAEHGERGPAGFHPF